MLACGSNNNLAVNATFRTVNKLCRNHLKWGLYPVACVAFLLAIARVGLYFLEPYFGIGNELCTILHIIYDMLHGFLLTVLFFWSATLNVSRITFRRNSRGKIVWNIFSKLPDDLKRTLFLNDLLWAIAFSTLQAIVLGLCYLILWGWPSLLLNTLFGILSINVLTFLLCWSMTFRGKIRSISYTGVFLCVILIVAFTWVLLMLFGFVRIPTQSDHLSLPKNRSGAILDNISVKCSDDSQILSFEIWVD